MALITGCKNTRKTSTSSSSGSRRLRQIDAGAIFFNCACMQQPLWHDFFFPPSRLSRIVVVNVAYVWTAPDLDVLFSKGGGGPDLKRRSPPRWGWGERKAGGKPLRSVRRASPRPGPQPFICMISEGKNEIWKKEGKKEKPPWWRIKLWSKYSRRVTTISLWPPNTQDGGDTLQCTTVGWRRAATGRCIRTWMERR